MRKKTAVQGRTLRIGFEEHRHHLPGGGVLVVFGPDNIAYQHYANIAATLKDPVNVSLHGE